MPELYNLSGVSQHMYLKLRICECAEAMNMPEWQRNCASTQEPQVYEQKVIFITNKWDKGWESTFKKLQRSEQI